MTPEEWGSDLFAMCPVCGFKRGDHWSGFCRSVQGNDPEYSWCDANGKQLEYIDYKAVPGKNQPQGRFGVPINYGQGVVSKTPTQTGILSCSVCKIFSEYFQPNQPDGKSFICYSCRGK